MNFNQFRKLRHCMPAAKIARQAGFVAVMAVVAALGFSASVQAACVITASVSNLDFGTSTMAALPASNVSGFRSMGVRQLSVNGVCDASQAALSLSFEGFQTVSGKSLTRWITDGALIYHVDRMSVGGVDVPFSVAGASTPGYVTSTELFANSTLNADLSRISATARRNFSIQLTITGLLPNEFAPRSLTQLNSQFVVRLLNAN